MKYSIIVPVFNRPEEVDELLESLTQQTMQDMEVIIVEDGSSISCESVVHRYAGLLQLRYYTKENSGPGQTRNFGAERSQGEYLIFLDSDCMLPSGFLQAVDEELCREDCDAWGGPDRAHESFTPVQKAINYSMTSFLTTGGIRGGKKQMDRKFYPRSFNLGIRSSLYRQLGGFSAMRFGEDIDLSLRIYESGASCRLFPEAWVWHKRRTDFRKFFRQVHNSGIARINLMKRHPGSLKAVHLLPTVFTVGTIALILLSAVGRVLMEYGGEDSIHRFYWLCAAPWIPILLFCLVIFIDASIRNKSLKIGALSVCASFVQLFGYGCGFLVAWWKRCVLGKDEFQAFEKNFYK